MQENGPKKLEIFRNSFLPIDWRQERKKSFRPLIRLLTCWCTYLGIHLHLILEKLLGNEEGIRQVAKNKVSRNANEKKSYPSQPIMHTYQAGEYC